MKIPQLKVHYYPDGYLQCGAPVKRNTLRTYTASAMTCRTCMYSYLVELAPWAKEFLDELRRADIAAKRTVKPTEELT